MVTRFLRTCILLQVIFVLFHGISNAEEHITLEKALAIACDNNARITNAKKNVETAQAKLLQAAAYPNPSLEFQTTDVVDPLAKDKGSYEAGLYQEIEVFGKRGDRKSAAENAVSIANEELASIRLDVSLEIKERYYDLLLFQKRNDIARENLNLVRKLLDSVQVKYNSGTVYRNELLRAKIELTQAENELLLSEKEYKATKAEFNLLLGVPVSRDFVLEGQLAQKDTTLVYDTLLGKALSGNPELKAKMLLADLNKKDLKLARKEVLPNPTLGLIRTKEGPGTSLGGGIRVSIPLWYRNAGAIKEKETELAKTENESAYLRKQLELSIYDAYIEAEAALKQVYLLKKNVEEANEIQNLIDLQYKEGKAEFLAYLDSLRTVRLAKLNYYEAIMNYDKKLALIGRIINEDLE